MSVQLEVSLSPHPQPDLGARCKIIRVELHVGRDQLGQWHADDKDNDWSVDEDIRIPVWSDIVGVGDNPFNNNPRGCCVTLIVEFRGGSSLLVSSVALIQFVKIVRGVTYAKTVRYITSWSIIFANRTSRNPNCHSQAILNMTNFIEEMIDKTWEYEKGRGRKDRKWGFTIYRTYYGEESDDAWQMLLYSLRHQTKLAFGAFAPDNHKEIGFEEEIKQDDIQRLKDLFSLDVREDPALFDGFDIPRLREFAKKEKEDRTQIINVGAHRRKGIWPKGVRGMADWVFNYVLLADESVLKDVARGEFIVKAVSVLWREGHTPWGWMRIPTGYLVELWHHLIFHEDRTENALSFDGDEEELENLIWAGDGALFRTGQYSEIRDGCWHYDTQDLRTES
ncbi:hypothetical protein FLAG1_07175 [Fusarium langsethiae]|uniref:Uncharacterized protein n=1 Tax=Fusarium langsethiae TaxID=179993 RepID=A0A0M9EUJ8_FUSLA|nr:hypothetical protein FLAG1_07175 [Fusarium langsethiae]